MILGLLVECYPTRKTDMKYVLDVLIKLAFVIILWGFIAISALMITGFWYMLEALQ